MVRHLLWTLLVLNSHDGIQCLDTYRRFTGIVIPEGAVTSEILEAIVTDLITARCATLNNCPHTDADTARRCSRCCCYRARCYCWWILYWSWSRGWTSSPRSVSELVPCCYFRKERISNNKRKWTWLASRGRFVMEAMIQWEIELSTVRGKNLPGALVTGRGALAPHGTRSAANGTKIRCWWAWIFPTESVTFSPCCVCGVQPPKLLLLFPLGRSVV